MVCRQFLRPASGVPSSRSTPRRGSTSKRFTDTRPGGRPTPWAIGADRPPPSGTSLIRKDRVLGRRPDIALIGESEAVYRRHTGFAARALTGFQRGVAERGLRAVHRPCEGTYESAAGVLARILEERPTTTGFVVQNEAAIAPLLSLLRLAGRVVPPRLTVRESSTAAPAV